MDAVIDSIDIVELAEDHALKIDLLWTDQLAAIVYIGIRYTAISGAVGVMMDYISISLALLGGLLLWWSFLAISGLKRSKFYEEINSKVYLK